MKNNFTSLIGISGKIGSGKDLVGLIIQIVTRYYDHKELYTDKDIDQCIFEAVLSNRNSYKPYPSNWEIRKFADKLKDIVCLLIGCTRWQLEDRKFKEQELGEEWWYYKVEYDDFDFFGEDVFMDLKDAKEFYRNLKTNGYYENISEPILIKLTPRKLLQLLGTECGRNIIHPNIWVNALFADYKPRGFIKSPVHGTIKEKVNNDNWETTDYPYWLITDTRFPNEADAIKKRGGINIRVNRIKEKVITGDITQDILRNTKDFGVVEHESETALDNYQFDYVIDNNGTIEELIKKVKEILIKERII